MMLKYCEYTSYMSLIGVLFFWSFDASYLIYSIFLINSIVCLIYFSKDYIATYGDTSFFRFNKLRTIGLTFFLVYFILLSY